MCVLQCVAVKNFSKVKLLLHFLHEMITQLTLEVQTHTATQPTLYMAATVTMGWLRLVGSLKL